MAERFTVPDDFGPVAPGFVEAFELGLALEFAECLEVSCELGFGLGFGLGPALTAATAPFPASSGTVTTNMWWHLGQVCLYRPATECATFNSRRQTGQSMTTRGPQRPQATPQRLPEGTRSMKKR
jgi:hypothetical protein